MTAGSTHRGRPLLLAALVIGLLVAVSGWMHLQSSTPRPEAIVESPAPPEAPLQRPVPAPAFPGETSTRIATATPQLARASIARRMAMQEQIGREAASARNAAAAAFLRETVDSRWAPSKQVELDTIASMPAIAASGASPTQFDVDCRRSLCRIDASFATAAQADDWSMLFTASLGDAMPSSTVTRVPAADGSTHIEIYGKAR